MPVYYGWCPKITAESPSVTHSNGAGGSGGYLRPTDKQRRTNKLRCCGMHLTGHSLSKLPSWLNEYRYMNTFVSSLDSSERSSPSVFWAKISRSPLDASDLFASASQCSQLRKHWKGSKSQVCLSKSAIEIENSSPILVRPSVPDRPRPAGQPAVIHI